MVKSASTASAFNPIQKCAPVVMIEKEKATTSNVVVCPKPVEATVTSATSSASGPSNEAAAPPMRTTTPPISNALVKKLQNLGMSMRDLAEVSERTGLSQHTVEFVFRNIVQEADKTTDFKKICEIIIAFVIVG